jgi:hypothetical protein
MLAILPRERSRRKALDAIFSIVLASENADFPEVQSWTEVPIIPSHSDNYNFWFVSPGAVFIGKNSKKIPLRKFTHGSGLLAADSSGLQIRHRGFDSHRRLFTQAKARQPLTDPRPLLFLGRFWPVSREVSRSCYFSGPGVIFPSPEAGFLPYASHSTSVVASTLRPT